MYVFSTGAFLIGNKFSRVAFRQLQSEKFVELLVLIWQKDLFIELMITLVKELTSYF